MDSVESPIIKKFNAPQFVKSALLLPLLFLAIFAPFSESLDLRISHYFFRDNQFANTDFLNFIYDYAIFPGWILAGIGLSGFLIASLLKDMQKYLRIFLFLVLTLGIGSGIIVHALLKDHWGRPRPKQTIEFGGNQPFQPFYQPNFTNQLEPAKSFSCGHCTMGFYFFSLMFVGIALKNRRYFWLGLIASFLLGGLLGYARIAQGGHFFSDVIISAIIMWWTSVIGFFFIKK